VVSGHEKHSTARVILVADPCNKRRAQLVRGRVGPVVVEAASLLDAYNTAEDSEPQMIALWVDFSAEPELEGLLRVAELLRSQVVLYGDAAHKPARRVVGKHLPFLTLQPGDTIHDLLARLGDSGGDQEMRKHDAQRPDLILIGASTGGVMAIETVLSGFPADCPPTLVVQHIRDGFAQGMVRRLDSICRPNIVAAVDGIRLSRGTVYIAADMGRHLTVGSPNAPRCALVDAPPRNGHRPAVDPLFESALSWGARVSAALLTGMGVDGAKGMSALRAGGAHTIAQNQETCVVWGMPRAAVEAGAAADVLPIERIANALLSTQSRPGRGPQVMATR